VLQLSDVTQQNAALVEESAAASSSLNDQAQRLVELVRVFRLESGQAAQGNVRSQVISVPPATIEEGVPRAPRASTAPRSHGGGTAARAAGAAAAPRTASRPASSSSMGAKPAALGTAATAMAGSTVYGPGASKEDDWEEF